MVLKVGEVPKRWITIEFPHLGILLDYGRNWTKAEVITMRFSGSLRSRGLS